jgi:hypothetical protein
MVIKEYEEAFINNLVELLPKYQLSEYVCTEATAV